MISYQKQNDFSDLILIEPSPFEDFRGIVVETYNRAYLNSCNIKHDFYHDVIIKSRKNVLRGIHGDSTTSKLISCVYGSIYFVAVHCDPEKETFGHWQSFILSDNNHHQILVPPYWGSSYLILSDYAVVNYKQDTYYNRKSQFTYKWNDKKFNIFWPIDNPILSERDKSKDGE